EPPRLHPTLARNVHLRRDPRGSAERFLCERCHRDGRRRAGMSARCPGRALAELRSVTAERSRPDNESDRPGAPPMSTLTARPGRPTASGGAPSGVTSTAAGSVQLVPRLVSVALLCILPVLVITVDVLADGPLRHLDRLLAAGDWHRADGLAVQAAYVFDRLGQRAIAGTVLV